MTKLTPERIKRIREDADKSFPPEYADSEDLFAIPVNELRTLLNIAEKETACASCKVRETAKAFEQKAQFCSISLCHTELAALKAALEEKK